MNKDYDYILFDLDGTVTDSSMGITNSVSYALKMLGITPPPREALYTFIGPSLNESFKKYYNMTEEEAANAVSLYRVYYREKGILELETYPGTEKLLSSLKNAGKTVILATAKPEPFAKQIITHLGFDGYFSLVVGSLLDRSREKKSDIINVALSSLGISDKEKCLMVGDREHDIIGAHEVGIDGCGILHGFGSKEEFINAGADYILKDFFELEEFLNL